MSMQAPLNSRDWWESYFEETWEANDGRNQTHHFMTLLLQNLPDTELAFLMAHQCSILDWGCALGDGAALLAETFSRCTVSGLDFAARAVAKAQGHFPGLEFIHSTDGAIPREFDVITISNCLEHFERPLDLVKQQLRHCCLLYIALVPYNEHPLHEQHTAQFRDESFPPQVDGFQLLHVAAIDADPLFWPGQQLIAVYGSGDYIARREQWLASGAEVPQAPALLAGSSVYPALPELAHARTQLARLALTLQGERAAHTAQRERAESRYQADTSRMLANERAQAQAALEAREREFHAEREEALARLREELAQRHAEALRTMLEAEREHWQDELRDTSASGSHLLRLNDERIEALRTERDLLQRQLAEMYSSRPWRLALAYWDLRRQGVPGLLRFIAHVPAYAAQALYHALVPEAIRLDLWYRRHTGQGYKESLPPMRLPAVQPAPVIELPRSSRTEEVLASRGPDIICFPVIDWDFRFQRPQQLLTQFARAGHRGYYLNIKFIDEPDVRARALGTRLWELSVPGDASTVIYTDAFPKRSLVRSIVAMRRFCQAQDITDAVCLVQHPFWTPLARALGETYGWKLVYDCMDDHSGFETNGARVIEQERELVESSDLVVTTSRLLHGKMSARHDHCVLVPNAGDYDHFSVLPPRRGSPLADLPAPVIGYYGAIAEWFDADALLAAATRHPEWSFVLIGHTFGADIKALAALPNVRFPGEQSYAQLPAYLAGFDVCTIPFKRIPLTEATNPVKVFEYLAAGKPVVARRLPEVEPYANVVSLYETCDEFIRLLEQATQLDAPGAARARQAVARAHTWADRYQTFATALRALYGTVCIIVVTYNNLDYTRETIQSVLAKTQYPQYDIIVVDNGSADAVAVYLREVAAQHPNIHLILNGENRGFAAANNVGIQAALARGAEYIVLLNNDVVVTPGWLGRLLRHLRNPDIGLVGPVTSFAGNEARIEIDYTTVDGIDDFARRYTSAHAGGSFDIPMLAMFCVAARRAVMEQVGELDERFGIGMFEDDDYSLRVRQAGYRLVCAEDVFVHHFGRVSFARLEDEHYRRLFEENRQIFEQKWQRQWTPPRARGNGKHPVTREAMLAMTP